MWGMRELALFLLPCISASNRVLLEEAIEACKVTAITKCPPPADEEPKLAEGDFND
jgi:hypothetical protein